MVRTLTVLGERESTIEAEVGPGEVRCDPARLPEAVGWSLEPQGLCRGDVCRPVRGELRGADGLVDLLGVLDALDRPHLLDTDEGVLVAGVSREDRRHALRDRVAPDVELPDLDGRLHRLESFHGRRRLLVAFASW